jgi:hypothetical protein
MKLDEFHHKNKK